MTVVGDVLWAVLFLVVCWLQHRYLRRNAIACASEWTSRQGLAVLDWSKAHLQIYGLNPSLTFVAASPSAPLVDVKLRLRNRIFHGWQVREVAYCLPRGAFEDDTKPCAP